MDLEPSLLKEEIERNHEEGQVGETPKRFISQAEPHTDDSRARRAQTGQPRFFVNTNYPGQRRPALSGQGHGGLADLSTEWSG